MQTDQIRWDKNRNDRCNRCMTLSIFMSCQHLSRNEFGKKRPSQICDFVALGLRSAVEPRPLVCACSPNPTPTLLGLNRLLRQKSVEYGANSVDHVGVMLLRRETDDSSVSWGQFTHKRCNNALFLIRDFFLPRQIFFPGFPNLKSDQITHHETRIDRSTRDS